MHLSWGLGAFFGLLPSDSKFGVARNAQIPRKTNACIYTDMYIYIYIYTCIQGISEFRLVELVLDGGTGSRFCPLNTFSAGNPVRQSFRLRIKGVTAAMDALAKSP